MIRLLAFLAALVLLVFPAIWLFEATTPVPRMRTGGAADFLYFAATIGVVYGGVAVGAGVYWARTWAAGRALGSPGLFGAGVAGAGAVSLAVVFAFGVHGLITSGSFERGVGNLWGLIVIFAVLAGALVAAGLALLWFALRRPAGHGRASGPPHAGSSTARRT